MSRCAASRLAWSIWALSLASTVMGAVFRSLNGAPNTVSQDPLVFDVWFMLVSLSFATVGALVASRQPGNVIGWILCALGACNSLAVVRETMHPKHISLWVRDQVEDVPEESRS